jgi:hypothetical protein
MKTFAMNILKTYSRNILKTFSINILMKMVARKYVRNLGLDYSCNHMPGIFLKTEHGYLSSCLFSIDAKSFIYAAVLFTMKSIVNRQHSLDRSGNLGFRPARARGRGGVQACRCGGFRPGGGMRGGTGLQKEGRVYGSCICDLDNSPAYMRDLKSASISITRKIISGPIKYKLTKKKTKHLFNKRYKFFRTLT